MDDTPTGHSRENAAHAVAAGKALVSALESMDKMLESLGVPESRHHHFVLVL